MGCYLEYVAEDEPIDLNNQMHSKSSISFFINGIRVKRFNQVPKGVYMPTVSAQRNAALRINLGPHFYFKPEVGGL